MFVVDDIFHVLTLEDKVVIIDMKTGLIIDRIAKRRCKYFSNSYEIENVRTIYYRDIEYPDGYLFPDLTSGEQFRESLIKGLNRIEVSAYANCNYYILIYGAIDADSSCEIFLLRATVDGEKNEEWYKEVSLWIVNQKYKTDLIPENCDKWVFQEYFYLK